MMVVNSAALITEVFPPNERGRALEIGTGWTSTPPLILYLIFVVGVVFFLFWERWVKSPVPDFSLFKSRVYTFSVLAALLLLN